MEEHNKLRVPIQVHTLAIHFLDSESLLIHLNHTCEVLFKGGTAFDV
jgi:hypothetical protein